MASPETPHPVAPPDVHAVRGAGEPIRPEVADWIRRQGGVLRSLLEGGINETDLLIVAERLGKFKSDKKIAYLFGPVSGQIEQAKTEFAVAQEMLEARGLVVWNPIERANNPQAEAEEKALGKAAPGKPGWQGVMRTCFQDVLGATVLYGLPGWWESTGACLEALFASVIGTPVYQLGRYPTDSDVIRPDRFYILRDPVDVSGMLQVHTPHRCIYPRALT